jgi:hypothetical protein
MTALLSRVLALVLSSLADATCLYSASGSIPATLALLFGSHLLAIARRRVQVSRLVLGLS